MKQIEDILENIQYPCDSDCLSDILNDITPFITHICRKYIANQSDVDDAVQETVIKYVYNLSTIRTNHSAWLARTARNTSISINKHQRSQRIRRENSATVKEHEIPWDALYYRLDQALLRISNEHRQYIIQYHMNKVPLFEIAQNTHISQSTASRRLASAHHALRNAFKDMNLDTYDDLCNAHLFVTSLTNYAPQNFRPHKTFNFEQDLADTENSPLIRIGTFISRQSYLVPGRFGFTLPMSFQIGNLRHFEHPNVRIVGLIEPGTIDYGPIESTLRNYSFNAGYMNATDTEALKTLDVITLGLSFSASPSVVNAITEAVESGVGLLNEGYFGCAFPGMNDPKIRRLSLMKTLYGVYHTHPNICHLHTKNIVKQSHNILPGLSMGTEIELSGCAPVFTPTPKAKVLIESVASVLPNATRRYAVCPAPMTKPVLLTGKVGKGRVIVNTSYDFHSIGKHKKYRGDFKYNMLKYLAEPRLKRRIDIKCEQ
ncbi:sigma-70 family RNA polymerase sigma factor [Planctomycetota bacterium]|nr:sigma-70 family RNA polymerase sigma factor [Planctomycetota bacterium]